MSADPTLPESGRLKTSSRGLVVAGLISFLFLFVGMGLWMYFAKIEGAVIASGQVSVLGKPKTIQHLDGGIVADIYVDNSDVVSEGDVLLRLDDTALKSSLDIYVSRLRETLSRRDRLRAEQDGASQILWDDQLFGQLEIAPDPEFRAGQVKIFNARLATRVGQVSQLRERISQLRNQISGLEALSKSKQDQVNILRQEYQAIKGLADDGFASDNRVLRLERQISDMEGQRFEHQADVSRVLDSISEVELQISQINKEFDQDVLTELREAELLIKELEQQIIATQDKMARIELKAPIGGVIHEKTIFTIGGVITPGAPVLQIIPQTQEMEFEVNLEPQYIDQIYVGQPVSVMFSAFNARTTPQLNGSVSTVSINTSVMPETGISFYPVKVVVSEEEMQRLDGQKLVSGMPIEAFFTTESRSPLNYLIKPLTDYVKRAGREE